MTASSDRPRIFLSWSGALSQRVATFLHEWLPTVIQGIDPWISTRSIFAGDYWHRAITDNLRLSNIGIVVVTMANQESTWLNYETGALAQSVTTRDGAVMPLLVGLSVEDLTGPMKNLQVNTLDEAGMRNVLAVVNEHAQPKLSEKALEREFKLKWTELENEIADALAALGGGSVSAPTLPVALPDLTVEIVGVARAYQYDETLVESYIENRKMELFGHFPETGELTSPLIASPMASRRESRSPDQFRQEVDRWAADVRAAWASAVDTLAGAIWDAVTIKIENLTSVFLERLQLVITLPGSVDAIESLDSDGFEFETHLPDRPRAWGPSPYMLFDPAEMDISGIRRPSDATWRRVGDALEITVDVNELRPKRTIECTDELVLVVRSSEMDLPPIPATWSATVRNLDEVIEGECTIMVAPRAYDFTAGLRKLLEL